MKNYLKYSIFLTLLFVIFSCHKEEEPYVEVGDGFLRVLPLNESDFSFFGNLGHFNPPSHTFPSDHGGFILTNWKNKVPVFSPADMYITQINRVEHVDKGYVDYSLELSVNNRDFKLIFGHLSALQTSLESAVNWDEGEINTYSTGGHTYKTTRVKTHIEIKAGDLMAYGGGNPGQYGIDFGAFDKTKHIEFASDRFDNYDYVNTVSPLDYFTQEIRDILIPICGDFSGGVLKARTVPPIGGTIDYDLPGTLRGLWFKEGEPTFPEDPHLALVYSNVKPEIPFFSVGKSITNLKSGLYTFTPEDSGNTNRLFEKANTIGQMYIYEFHNYFPDGSNGGILLVQLTDSTHLKIECKSLSDGPPWTFTSKATNFIR